MIELEVGKRYRFEHEGRGRFRGVVLETSPAYARVRLDDYVRGAWRDWGPGEEPEVARAMLTGATELL